MVTGHSETGVDAPTLKSWSASAVPQSEQISVLLSALLIAPGYLPGCALVGIQLN